MIAQRAYQASALQAFRQRRMFCLLWERQAGKSTMLAEMALEEMMRHANRTCVYASASLLLAREIILKQALSTDLSIQDLLKQEAGMLFASAHRGDASARAANLSFQTADAARNKILPRLTRDDFTELFEAQRLEFRVYHDSTSYSRTQVIAANVATARGWSGTV